MQSEAFVYANPSKLFVYKGMTFGDWLRAQLLVRDISNAELARRVDVSATYIGNLVRDYSPNTKSGKGKPSEEVVDAIARALGANGDEARLAAGYAPRNGVPIVNGYFKGIEKLSPERQELARRQIRAIIDSLAEEEHDTDYIDDEEPT